MDTEKIKSKDDEYIVFTCGHGELNPSTKRAHRYKFYCSACGQSRPIREKFYMCKNEGCGTIVHRKFRKGNTPKYCEECRREVTRANLAGCQRERRFNQFRRPGENEMSVGEIAEQMGCSRQNVCQLISSGLKKFFDNWRRDIGTDPFLDGAVEPYEYHKKIYSYGGGR